MCPLCDHNLRNALWVLGTFLAAVLMSGLLIFSVVASAGEITAVGYDYATKTGWLTGSVCEAARPVNVQVYVDGPLGYRGGAWSRPGGVVDAPSCPGGRANPVTVHVWAAPALLTPGEHTIRVGEVDSATGHVVEFSNSPMVYRISE